MNNYCGTYIGGTLNGTTKTLESVDDEKVLYEKIGDETQTYKIVKTQGRLFFVYFYGRYEPATKLEYLLVPGEMAKEYIIGMFAEFINTGYIPETITVRTSVMNHDVRIVMSGIKLLPRESQPL